MKHYKVVFRDGIERDIFADDSYIRREEKENQRNEYGQRKSFIVVLEFIRRDNPNFDQPIAIFNFENIAGFYELLECETNSMEASDNGRS